MSRKLTRFVRNMALREIDGSNTKISARNKVLLERLEPYLNKTQLQSLGIRLYFKKYFENYRESFMFEGYPEEAFVHDAETLMYNSFGRWGVGVPGLVYH